MVTLLIQKFLLLAAASTAVSAVDYIAKPGCQDSCGNLSIPHPFGTREGCYLDYSFLITCNATTKKSYLQYGNVQVLNISLDGQIRISSEVAVDCYDQEGNRDYSLPWTTMGNVYTLSSSLNKFMAYGCDTIARIEGIIRPSLDQYITGCISYCDSTDSVVNGSCSGAGCCQVSIPKGARSFNITLESYFNHSNVINYNPCSYAFVVEDGFYNFNSLDLASDPSQAKRTFPVVYDWTVGNTTCAEAKRNQSTYACKDENSMCLDSDKRDGYLCICLSGFHGNPCLSNGCQDNDECALTSLNDCLSISTCRNINGGYTCICPEGYLGDGRKNGQGCLVDPAKSVKLEIIVGVASGFGFLLLLIGLWLSYTLVKRRRVEKTKQKFFKRNGGFLLKQRLSSTEQHVEKTTLFTSKDLDIATDHYNVNRILGQGGQGTVYKGMLSDGRVVAIKKSKVVDEDKLGQFTNEVFILSQINHRNVVKLFGCCLETEVPMLVYEFIPNGALFEFLHNKNEQEFQITWEMRLQIATEVAGALAYLHSSASIPIYHRDIKTSNILLDEKYRAKVADFGTSKSISIDETHVTTRVEGTLGYLDPEYLQSSQYTEKSDVYSFGVVLVELLTGQKPISVLRSVEGRSLATYFLLSMEDNRLFDIVDGPVLKEGRKEEIIGIAKLAKSCLNLNGKKRPNMKTVAMELERIRACEGTSSNSDQEYEEVDYVVGHYTGFEIASSSTKSIDSSSKPLLSI